MKYRWIFKQKGRYKGAEYEYYSVIINQKYRYSSSVLENCIDFLLHFAEKHEIPKENILKTKKHTRIKV